MVHRIRIVRPDDLLNLDIECINLRLDQSDPAQCALVPENVDQPAFLVYTFPPQAIAEQAYFQSTTTPPLPREPPANRIPNPPEGDDLLPVPGTPARASIGGATRLVFRVPSSAGTRIPYAVDSLLDWSGFELSISPLAAVPPQPTAEQAENAPALTAPEPTHTLIELPYHLQLSPGSNTAWLAATTPVSHGGWSELWHARLVTRENAQESFREPTIAQPAPLRAIWATGFDPSERLDSTTLFAPDPDVRRAAMSVLDRKQIVALTSDFHGYVSVDLPTGAQTVYQPRPIFCERLMLSPLGGWLRSHGNWDPPWSTKPRFSPHVVTEWHEIIDPLLRADVTRREVRRMSVEPARVVGPDLALRRDTRPVDVRAAALTSFIPGFTEVLDQQLSLSEWTHVASQGRDHYVRVVYNGCLCGTDHPASLVKVTERRFRDVNGTAVAYLAQFMYVVVRQPEVDYSSRPIAHQGRALPFKRIHLTTTVTPPIANPTIASSSIPGSSSFWVMVTDPVTNGPVDFLFHGYAIDVAGHRIDFTAPFIFVPSGEDDARIQAVCTHYRADGGGRRRAFRIPGQPVTYATPDPSSGADNTTLTSEAFLLDVQPSSVTGCGFVPLMGSADVRIPAVEQLLGTNTAVGITLSGDFLANDFGAGTGVFADIVSGLPLNFAAAQSGGIATPNLNLSCLSRSCGPLAGDITKAASGLFDPAEFFPKGTAQLFGVIDLFDLLKPGGSIADNAPRLETVRDSSGKKIVTTIEWHPTMKDESIAAGLLSFTRDSDSTLTVTGRIERTIGVTAAPPYTLVRGVLTNFGIEFAKVVRIGFSAFEFKAEAGRKPVIDVKLKPGDPIGFLGALSFVDELRKHIPPGLFGDGPSLDINATRIRAGFGIALPPLTVAVFSLRNVTLNTALELPFSNGQPTFDFGFCERHQPFELAVALLGGGGFFHLQVDTAGIRQLEAALEFGAVAALDLGVASGSVHIMAGIYFAMNRDADGNLAAMLSGYLRCGGELSVLGLISISVEFNLSFTYDEAKHKASGRATLTVEVEIAFFSTSVELTVERSFGRDGGDPTFLQVFDTPAVWDEYAVAFA